MIHLVSSWTASSGACEVTEAQPENNMNTLILRVAIETCKTVLNRLGLRYCWYFPFFVLLCGHSRTSKMVCVLFQEMFSSNPMKLPSHNYGMNSKEAGRWIETAANPRESIGYLEYPVMFICVNYTCINKTSNQISFCTCIGRVPSPTNLLGCFFTVLARSSFNMRHKSKVSSGLA